MCSKWSWLRGQKPEQDNEKEGKGDSHKDPTVGWKPSERRGLTCVSLPGFAQYYTCKWLPRWCGLKNHLPTQEMSETQVQALEKGMATLFSILAWRIPCTEEPRGLQSLGSQRVRHK